MKNPLAGKSPTERNKIIAALILGVLSLSALYLAFGEDIFGGKTAVTVTQKTPTPRPKSNAPQAKVPTRAEVNFEWETTPINYQPGAFGAPDPGRNIFAFYEPGKPTPTPSVTPRPPTPEPIFVPEPTPEPDYVVGYTSPQNIYEGQGSFRLEVTGMQFTPDSYIVFNGMPLPTTYISPERLVAEVPANLILGPGTRILTVNSADGKFSNQVSFNVQAKPTPQFKYIGMIARKRYNNDTAYFEEPGKKDPTGARLNDIVGGRFRLVSISAKETVFEDKDLGFRHRVPLFRPGPSQSGIIQSGHTNTPYIPPPNPADAGDIPGIPSNIRRYNRNPNSLQNPTLQDDDPKKEDTGNEDKDDNPLEQRKRQ